MNLTVGQLWGIIAVPTIVPLLGIIAGIFFNQRAADRVRSDLTAHIDALRVELSARIDATNKRIDDLIQSKLVH